MDELVRSFWSRSRFFDSVHEQMLGPAVCVGQMAGDILKRDAIMTSEQI